MQQDCSPLEAFAPYLDLILTQTYDIPHSEWKGLDQLLQQLLFDAILSRTGQEQYTTAFQHFVAPAGWPCIQSPKTHLGS